MQRRLGLQYDRNDIGDDQNDHEDVESQTGPITTYGQIKDVVDSFF